MQISKNTVVTLNYRVTDPKGEVVDVGAESLRYVHGGHGGIFTKIESALEGREVGETLKVNLLPEDAFGLYEEDLVLEEARGDFPEALAVGMQFELVGEVDGAEGLYTVTAIDGDKVVLDGNHPLAGRPLVFTCTVAAVRAATPEEVRRGEVLDR